jgi:hypothetical protein
MRSSTVDDVDMESTLGPIEAQSCKSDTRPFIHPSDGWSKDDSFFQYLNDLSMQGLMAAEIQ